MFLIISLNIIHIDKMGVHVDTFHIDVSNYNATVGGIISLNS